LMMGLGLLLLHCECSILDQVCKLGGGGKESSEADGSSARPFAVGSS
jgi:hypothetical protein